MKIFLMVALLVALPVIKETDGNDLLKFCDGNRELLEHELEVGKQFVMQSAGYGDQTYPVNESCTIILKAKDKPITLKFTFKEFQVQTGRRCRRDGLCLYGIYFCGKWLKGKTLSFMVPPEQNFTTLFYSNDHISEKGFEATVYVEDSAKNPINMTYGGSGLDEESLFFKTQVHNKMFIKEYKDLCPKKYIPKIIKKD